MRFLFCLFIVCAGQFVAGDEVVFFVVDGHDSPVWAARYRELFDHYQLTEEMKSTPSVSGLWAGHHLDKYWDRDAQKGYIHTLGASGTWSQVGFVTLKSVDAFELLVSDDLEELEEQLPADLDANVIRSGDRLTIVNPAFRYRTNPRLSSPAWERHFRYIHPVLINDSGPNSLKRIEGVPLKKVVELLKPAHGKLSYYVFQPGELPEAIKAAAFQMIAGKAAPKLQQRDGEDDAAYSDRKATANAKLRLIRSLLFDVDRATAWTEWPKGDKPYRARGRVEAKKGSKLHRLFKTLNSEASRRVRLDAGNVGNMRMAVNIPKELLPLLNSWLRAVIGSEDGTDFLKSGAARFAGRLDIDADQLQFVAGCRGDLTDDAVQLLTKPKGPTLELGPIKLEPVRHAAAEVEGGIRLAFSAQANTNSPLRDTADSLDAKLELERSDSAPLGIVELDLAPLLNAKDNEQAQRLVRNIERAYIRSRQPVPSVIELLTDAPEKPEPGSLLRFASPEGDWTITARLDIRANVATLDVTIGADAHRFWRLRQVRYQLE